MHIIIPGKFHIRNIWLSTKKELALKSGSNLHHLNVGSPIYPDFENK